MDSEHAHEDSDRTPPKDYESTLEQGGAAPAGEPGATDEFELDLEVDDIQTRLPYGSEDIADK